MKVLEWYDEETEKWYTCLDPLPEAKRFHKNDKTRIVEKKVVK